MTIDRLPWAPPFSAFDEIWVADGEWYPGQGLANGGVIGDPPTPFCLVAVELRSGRVVKLGPRDFGPFPPYRLDAGTLFTTYGLAADFGGIHLPLGWGKPARALCSLIEFRHIANTAVADSQERKKGFYGLDGALRYFGLESIDLAHKRDMRARIMAGPPFSDAEERRGVEYCVEDTLALARIVPRLLERIPSFKHALFRADVQWAAAQEERRGVPLDVAKLTEIRRELVGMHGDLVRASGFDRLYKFDRHGKPHFNMELFGKFVEGEGLYWRRLPSGALSTEREAFEEAEARYELTRPELKLGDLRELRTTLSDLKLNKLAVGADGRNRTPLWCYGTKTARCAPSNSEYVFGPAKWIRRLIQAPSGLCLIHRDYKQEEPRIAAFQSDDRELLGACESGDLYLAMAEQLGFLRESMNEEEVGNVRKLFKIVVLAISYGLGGRSLAIKTGLSLYEANETIARVRSRFHRFEEYSDAVLDHAGLELELKTPLGWRMYCPPTSREKTLRNFPIQSTAAEVLHVLMVLAERRGVRIAAVIHDAVLVEGDAADAIELAAAIDRLMRDASAVVLKGFELPSDCRTIAPGDHYEEDRGLRLWTTINELLARRALGAA